jgi:thiamine pyrophosphate-dependent acetolactate synthase large subunit-like protein
VISYRDAVEIINRERSEAVCVTTMTQTRYWYAVSQRPDLDIGISNGMSKASSVALGVAIGAPDRRVITLDGDGSLVMNLGSLVTIAGQKPGNLYHFVFDNGMYAVTGGQPLPNPRVAYAVMAIAAGYAYSYVFSDAEELASDLPDVLRRPGPALAHLAVTPGPAAEDVDQTWESNATMPAQIRAVQQALRAD